MLLFLGKPEKKDLGEIQIKIFDEDGYILRQFLIRIVENDKYSDRNKKPSGNKKALQETKIESV